MEWSSDVSWGPSWVSDEQQSQEKTEPVTQTATYKKSVVSESIHHIVKECNSKPHGFVIIAMSHLHSDRPSCWLLLEQIESRMHLVVINTETGAQSGYKPSFEFVGKWLEQGLNGTVFSHGGHMGWAGLGDYIKAYPALNHNGGGLAGVRSFVEQYRGRNQSSPYASPAKIFENVQELIINRDITISEELRVKIPKVTQTAGVLTNWSQETVFGTYEATGGELLNRGKLTITSDSSDAIKLLVSKCTNCGLDDSLAEINVVEGGGIIVLSGDIFDNSVGRIYSNRSFCITTPKFDNPIILGDLIGRTKTENSSRTHAPWICHYSHHSSGHSRDVYLPADPFSSIVSFTHYSSSGAGITCNGDLLIAASGNKGIIARGAVITCNGTLSLIGNFQDLTSATVSANFIEISSTGIVDLSPPEAFIHAGVDYRCWNYPDAAGVPYNYIPNRTRTPFPFTNAFETGPMGHLESIKRTTITAEQIKVKGSKILSGGDILINGSKCASNTTSNTTGIILVPSETGIPAKIAGYQNVTILGEKALLSGRINAGGNIKMVVPILSMEASSCNINEQARKDNKVGLNPFAQLVSQNLKFEKDRLIK